ncbi:HesA/MoeB/ThiF family protein [Methanothermobacter tenebrarum]|uniref:HesA/MoeB/ThiF family protein n=1 Tax=Methanothermobacter tenebrarum TaxID=680118 RepID=A0A328P985_9EURY|nr:HesA/MoeB/ThiF family protein [Methanothermobacter tenebrarum]MBC7118580.1 HesA/MoeB/ThiF family protein [Methanobacteriaceae archaeon]NPV63908.1 HesA/MoeB/ThiF family protein [Methanobacteriaceae archaeon]RAO79087.1 HesA/MoeB/ThiF family protein [Methanothermobacter tenebrarum]
MPRRYEGLTYWEIITRQMGFLKKNEQLKLNKGRVAVIGCGGIGGAAIEMLVRMGVGSLSIVDKDTFSISNINRQLMSNFHNIGKPKVTVTQERIWKINPFIEIETFNCEVNEDNVNTIIENSDVVIDAMDNIISRIIVSRECKRSKIPFVHGAVHASMGQVTVFGDRTPSYEEVFKLPSKGLRLTDEVKEKVQRLEGEIPPVIGPVPNIVGCIESFEALKLLTGKGSVIWAPKLLTFDLLKDDPFKIVEL